MSLLLPMTSGGQIPSGIRYATTRAAVAATPLQIGVCVLVVAVLLCAVPTASAGQAGASPQPPPTTFPAREDGRIEIWVDLQIPALAAVASAPEPARVEHQAQLLTQQLEVAAALRGLGGEELGRVQLTRNAIAVAVPAAALDAVRALPGVLRVRPIVHRHRVYPQSAPH